jgi:hypothetical protein
MAARLAVHKRSQAIYTLLPSLIRIYDWGGAFPMMGLALALFIGLFAFGGRFMGWNDVHGNVQLGLFMSFIFGIVCGYRTRG